MSAAFDTALAEIVAVEVERQIVALVAKLVPPPKAPVLFLTTPQVAKALAVSVPTVLRLVKEGTLRVAFNAGRPGAKNASRYAFAEVERLAEERQTYAARGVDTSPLNDAELAELVAARDGAPR